MKLLQNARFWNGCLPVLCLLFFLVSCGSSPEEIPLEEAGPVDEYAEFEDNEPVIALPPGDGELPVSSFGEIWAYVVAGRESALTRGLPLSDIGYFGTEIDAYGKLTDVPNRRKLPAFSGRVHLVAACSSRSLTHFVLSPGSPERRTLVADLLDAAKEYDGLQIDFEYVPQRDGAAFLSFLAELRTGLGAKMFTIALPARTKKISNDVYDYEKIKPLVDRILVMAYDEHWSTSKPGPIASLPWCKRVADYSLNSIGGEKLIMGIPFYGRAWGDTNPSRALLYSGVEDVINDNRVAEIRRENGIPTFDYKVQVAVKVYYEDDYSLAVRMEMYKSLGVASIGFWRLGQETSAVWNILRLE
ncbi:MAG: glycoside hydrolase [Treponema sp.]|jgi:spore germination protein YaaH|nr:glycoside hydrolase [Treponema sp.]